VKVVLVSIRRRNWMIALCWGDAYIYGAAPPETLGRAGCVDACGLTAMGGVRGKS
jgi:hypothetical protein